MIDLRTMRETASGETSTGTHELVPREHEFEVSYTGPDGKLYRARLMSRIMDADERILIARIAAQRAGVPWAQLPSAHAARIWAIAVVAVQLREPPAWVSEWALMDDSLLFSIFDVLTVHDGMFFRRGADESGAEESQPRVAVDSSLVARAPAE